MKLGGRRSPFPDADLIRSLAALLDEAGLNEIEYAIGDRRIRVARSGPGAALPFTGASPAAVPAQPAAVAAEEPTAHQGAVTAPMVGTVYLAPQPDAPPFVRLGDAVKEGQPLLIIEAMKVMNQIHAHRAGHIAEILVADTQPVEYGALLMLIE